MQVLKLCVSNKDEESVNSICFDVSHDCTNGTFTSSEKAAEHDVLNEADDVYGIRLAEITWLMKLKLKLDMLKGCL